MGNFHDFKLASDPYYNLSEGNDRVQGPLVVWACHANAQAMVWWAPCGSQTEFFLSWRQNYNFTRTTQCKICFRNSCSLWHFRAAGLPKLCAVHSTHSQPLFGMILICHAEVTSYWRKWDLKQLILEEPSDSAIGLSVLLLFQQQDRRLLTPNYSN